MHNYLKKLSIVTICLCLALPLFGNSLADKAVNWLATMGFSPRLIVLVISMLPLIELRGSIPVAILLFRIPWQEAVLLSVVGNMIPIPFVLLLMEWFFAQLCKVKVGARLTNWLFARTRRKGKTIEKYQEIGLAIFVGIPLPGTGAWTGAFAAKLFGLKFWKSLLFIFIGVLIAAGVVTPLTLMGKMAIN